jgi:hypothetical protein
VRLQRLGNQPMLIKMQRMFRYPALFVILIHASNSVRDSTYLHRCALLSPAECPWARFYQNGDDSSEYQGLVHTLEGFEGCRCDSHWGIQNFYSPSTK